MEPRTAYVRVPKDIFEQICWILIHEINSSPGHMIDPVIDNFVELGDSWITTIDR